MNESSESSGAEAQTGAEVEARIETLRLVSYIVFGLAGLAFFLIAGDLPASRWEPLGAGSFPRMICAVLVVLCAMAAFGSWRALRSASTRIDLHAALPKWIYEGRLVIGLFAFFVVYLAALRQFGFSVSTLIFLLAAYFLLAPRTIRAALFGLVLAVLFSFGLNWLFADVFNVFLPRAIG